MKVTLIVATSLNGKITQDDNTDVGSWTSPEDKAFFRTKLDKAKLIVMGRGTYEVMKDKMVHRAGRLRVVFTHHPQKYKKEGIPGQLEFTNEQPVQLINRLNKLGYRQMLLVSGTGITTEFLRAGLVDEVYQTIEPILFMSGQDMVGDIVLNKKVKLVSMRKLNKTGTLLVHYRIFS